MPESRRPRSTTTGRALFGAAAVAVALLVGGCTGAKPEPRDYGKDYESNFMFGCTGIQSADGTTTIPEDSEQLASKSYCQCVYDGLEKKVPFDQVKSFEEKQSEAESGKDIVVPKDIQSVFDSCKEKA